MADYAPPTGPPPPKAPEVPAGWAARWNEQYKEWFYVNVYTKKSQWEKPTAPVFPVGEDAPNEPPPGYEPGHGPAPTDTKKNPYEDRTAGPKPPAASSAEDEDAKLAAKLQAEEDARARHSPAGPQYGGGANASYPPQSGSPYPQDQYSQDRDRDKAKGGFLGKLFGKGKAPGAAGYGGYSPQPQQNYYQSPPPQQQQQYGGYPNQGPPMGGGYGGGGYGGGYGGQPGYGQGPAYGGGGGGYGGGYGGGGYGGQPGYAQQQQPGRKPGMGGGMGMGLAGGALGLGAGMLGGAALASAVHEHHEHEEREEQEAYMDGYQDGQDNDFGGGDDFGGDF